ncbi:protein FAM221B isoform X1 [Sus scrofa]|uniref:protein FAM221B isoform X1 n=1 Tax=Sus scrofa TaxID=9823 RepID=UPI000A2B0D40|nr:protein FAM221B isoform X1 [Sus scrofa]
MEADKGTEEPHVTTEDAEEHPSSKDPSAEDSQEPPIPEIPLEPLASKSHIVPSTSQIPLETHTSETPLEPSIPGTPLALSASEVPLETPISKVPEKDLTFHTSARSPVPGSSSNDLKKDLLSHSPSSEDTSESEGLQKHPLSGPPAQVHLDTSAKEREEEEESKKGVNATDRTTHKAQHEHQRGKKKRKKGVSRYAVHPVVPAQQAEPGEAVKAVHREKCGAQVNYLFQWEKDAALNAIQTGLYIGWRCPHYLWDCFRIGEESKCFCGHLLREHQIISVWASAAASCSALSHHAQRRWVSSGSKDGPPLTPGLGGPSVAANTATKTTQLPGPIPAGSEAVAAAALSLISSVRPVTGAGRNMKLSLRPRRRGGEEGGLTEQTTRLSQRCLPSERPSATTLTRRPPRSRHPLTIPTPTLIPLGFHPPSGLAPCLGPVPDPLTSALPSSRDRQCLVQASVIHNKGKATGI